MCYPHSTQWRFMALTAPDTGPRASIDGVPTGIRTPVTAVKGLGSSTWNNGLPAPCAESVLSGADAARASGGGVVVQWAGVRRRGQ
jgi:hypothetical protein